MAQIVGYLTMPDAINLTSTCTALFSLRSMEWFSYMVMTKGFCQKPQIAALQASKSRVRRAVRLYYRMAARKPIRFEVSPAHSTGVRDVAVDSDHLLTSGGSDRTVLLWKADKPTEPIAQFVHPTAAAPALLYAPSMFEKLFVVGGSSADEGLTLWRIDRPQEPVGVFSGPRSWVCGIEVTRSGHVVSSGADRALWVHDPETASVVFRRVGIHSACVRTLYAYGNEVATACLDGVLRFWDVRSGRCHSSLQTKARDGLTSLHMVQEDIVYGARGSVGFLDRRARALYQEIPCFSGWALAIALHGHWLF